MFCFDENHTTEGHPVEPLRVSLRTTRSRKLHDTEPSHVRELAEEILPCALQTAMADGARTCLHFQRRMPDRRRADHLRQSLRRRSHAASSLPFGWCRTLHFGLLAGEALRTGTSHWADSLILPAVTAWHRKGACSLVHAGLDVLLGAELLLERRGRRASPGCAHSRGRCAVAHMDSCVPRKAVAPALVAALEESAQHTPSPPRRGGVVPYLNGGPKQCRRGTGHSQEHISDLRAGQIGIEPSSLGGGIEVTAANSTERTECTAELARLEPQTAKGSST